MLVRAVSVAQTAADSGYLAGIGHRRKWLRKKRRKLQGSHLKFRMSPFWVIVINSNPLQYLHFLIQSLNSPKEGSDWTSCSSEVTLPEQRCLAGCGRSHSWASRGGQLGSAWSLTHLSRICENILLFLLVSVYEVHVYTLVYASVCIGVNGCVLVSSWQRRPEVQVECLLQSSSRLHHALCRVRIRFVVGMENPEFCLEYVNFKVPMTHVSCVQTGRSVMCALVTFQNSVTPSIPVAQKQVSQPGSLSDCSAHPKLLSLEVL